MIYVLMILSFCLQLAIPRPDAEARIPTSSGPSLEPMISAQDRPESTAPPPRLGSMRARADLSGRTARLVAAYGFEEAIGYMPRDASGQGYPGILVSAVVTEEPPGPSGAATGHARQARDLPSTPSRFDMWLATRLAMPLTRSQGFDLFVEQGVAYGVLGGVWYAAALFLFWVRGAQPGQQDVRRRTLTLALGSFVAALLTLFEARVVSWPPPSVHPQLAGLYPGDFPVNFNANSFPSQSTALYAAVASGLYTLSKTLGVWAWIGVGMIVALPRMYLGGHYLTDIVGGLAAGLGGYWLAVLLLGRTVVPWCEAAFEHGWDDWRRTVAEGAVFLWILQVAVEFSHVVWMTNALVSPWK